MHPRAKIHRTPQPGQSPPASGGRSRDDELAAAASMLRLQRVAGNGAVTRVVQRGMVAPGWGVGGAPVVQRQQDPAALLPDPAAKAATTFTPPGGGRLSSNPDLQGALFPFRRQMLEKFVGLYQSIELDQLDPVTKEATLEKILSEVRAEQAKLTGLGRKTPEETKRAQELEAMLKRAERDAATKLAVAKQWRSKHATPGQSLAALETEITRLGLELGLPDWVATAMIEFAGMRYGRTDQGGGKSAHGSYYSPQRLLWALAKTRDPGIGKAAQAAFFTLSTGEALGRIKAMREQNQVPLWAWQRIVYQTDLRVDPANTNPDWNKPAAVPKGEGGKPSDEDAIWQRVLNLWLSQNAKDIAPGERGPAFGSTGWRAEMFERARTRMTGFSANIALGVVCNELSEAIMADQGVRLPGGIAANAAFFSSDAKDPTKRPAGMYFGRVAPEFLHPGAVLFRIDKTWARAVAGHDEVKAAGGVDYTFPTADPKPDPKVTDPPAGTSWRNIAVPGERVRRESDGEEKVTQYVRWQHQMTVADVRGDRVILLETGDQGAGVYEKSAAALQGDPYVFLGAKDERQVITIGEVTVVGDPRGGPDPDSPGR
ncbi:hypothetical protein [Micromonospora sp. NPDC093277]|uniref:hypothetical protein n=1 Tax=Micromonospora sp. NPDC093277 TaxID=3364291 RepID=UPI003806C109